MEFDAEIVTSTRILEAISRSLGLSPAMERLFVVAVALAALVTAITPLLMLLKGPGSWVIAGIRRARLSPEDARRLARRRQFAEFTELELRRIDQQQEWSDHRFAELEAEVEAEGRTRLRYLPFARNGSLRREGSLSNALARSRERLVLLEGDPGSGKSVALRHVARTMARDARKGGLKAPIPLYVNLRELVRDGESPVDAAMIHAFVLGQINRPNDRDVAEFLREEFDRGLQEGTWCFLLDAFDEIPELLSSTEPDVAVVRYATAIEDFVSGMRRTRAVLASRAFRGPGSLPWPRFRILPLSDRRRAELVRRARRERRIESTLLGQLSTASSSFGDLVRNPLFLGLVVEQASAGDPFPDTPHVVFERYVVRRLERDAAAVVERFGVSAAEVRAVAERVAYCMSADAAVGLSATRDAVTEAMARHRLESTPSLGRCLDALVFMKLAREELSSPGQVRFAFAHRRFQEYFATSLLLKRRELVDPQTLLLDGRWREAAAVVCQTAPADAVAPLLDRAAECLRAARAAPRSERWTWPPHVLHVLALLQAGFAGRPDALPTELRRVSGEILTEASRLGTLLDHKWALEVAGPADADAMLEMLRAAFAGRSQWLADTAYLQVARLREVPDDLKGPIYRAIAALCMERRLRAEYYATYAHLSRLPEPAPYLRALRLLSMVPALDFALGGVGCGALAWITTAPGVPLGRRVALAAIFALFAISMWTTPQLFGHVEAAVASLTRARGWAFVRFLLASRASGFVAFARRQLSSGNATEPGPPRDALLGLFVRGYVVAAAVLASVDRLGKAWTPITEFVTRSTLAPTAFAVAVFLVCVALAWAPLAVIAASRGHFTHVWLWPAIPFYLFVKSVASLQRWRSLLLGLKLAAGVSAVLVPAALLMMVLQSVIGDWWLNAIVLAFYGLFAAALLWSAIQVAMELRRVTRKVNAARPSSLQTWIREASLYKNPYAVRRLFDEVKRRGLLSVAPGDLGRLRQIIADIETGAAWKGEELPPEFPGLRWADVDARVAKEWDRSVVEGLCLLAESLAASERDEMVARSGG